MKILIRHLHCLLCDETDKDEVYLVKDGERIWPEKVFDRMDCGDRRAINVTLSHQGDAPLQIQLWDFDFLSPNDLLGIFSIHLTQNDVGSYSTTLAKADMNSTASYILEWEVCDAS
jgi:hypothetical protein